MADAGRMKVPMRTCVGCGSVREQTAMARFVSRDGRLEADPDRKLGGRGAYICRTRECASATVVKKGRLSRALRASVEAPDEAWLMAALGI